MRFILLFLVNEHWLTKTEWKVSASCLKFLITYISIGEMKTTSYQWNKLFRID